MLRLLPGQPTSQDDRSPIQAVSKIELTVGKNVNKPNRCVEHFSSTFDI